MKPLYLFLLLFFHTSCTKKATNSSIKIENNTSATQLNYATGFTIDNFENYQLLTLKNPWPNAKKTYKFALSKQPEKVSFLKDSIPIIPIPLKKIVVTSTTHIPALELLEVENTLVGFPGTDYISSEKTRKRIAAGKVKEVGKNETINTELVLALQPNVVVGFGVDGVNKAYTTITNAGIPVIYNGEWVEKSPLAKAEWIKFFGALYAKNKLADSIFKTITASYFKAKQLVKNSTKKPTVLCGAMHKDIWYLPSGTSPEAQLLKDANLDYLWQNTTSQGSLALSFESVFEQAKNAEYWISPSYFTSKKALLQANMHYTKFKAYTNNKIYSFANTTGKTGGVLYYELGTARPDLVLKDLIHICHENILPNYQPTFFKKLP